MNKSLRIAGLLMAAALVSWSCGKTEAKSTDIRVETAKCEMCVTAIENAVGDVSGVKSVSVDLETKVATVTYNTGETSVGAIEDAIVMAGYAANDKPADPDAYEALPDCCKVHQAGV